MSKIIISKNLLGPHFPDVVMTHVNVLIKKKKLNAGSIQHELNQVENQMGFEKIIHKYFGDKIKLI